MFKVTKLLLFGKYLALSQPDQYYFNNPEKVAITCSIYNEVLSLGKFNTQ